jgi:hypothetical protein
MFSFFFIKASSISMNFSMDASTHENEHNLVNSYKCLHLFQNSYDWPKALHVYANTCDTKDSIHFNLRTNTP